MGIRICQNAPNCTLRFRAFTYNVNFISAKAMLRDRPGRKPPGDPQSSLGGVKALFPGVETGGPELPVLPALSRQGVLSGPVPPGHTVTPAPA